MPIKFDLKQFNNNRIFIETGTYLGDGVKTALKSGFMFVISIELDRKRYLEAEKIFKQYHNVILLYGDSSTILPKLMKRIHEPCTFWLDAHYCGEALELNITISEKWCPLSEELEAIQNHSVKNHTILIDDMRCMGNNHIEKKTKKPIGFPVKENLLNKLKEINNNYSFSYLDGHVKDDVLVAQTK